MGKIKTPTFDIECPHCGIKIPSRDGKYVLRKYASHLIGIKIACGCGECSEQIDFYNSKKSYICQYAKGHQMIGRPSKRKGTGKCNSTEMILCLCGCGKWKRRFDKWGQESHYINRHERRGKPGAMLGRKQPNSQREKLSEFHSRPEQVIKDKQNRFGRKTEYKGIIFRSKAEAERAEQLDAMGFHWQHEKTRLQYTDAEGVRRHYLTDFWIEELARYEEVKGYYFHRDYANSNSKRDGEKMDAIKKSNPNVVIRIIDREALNLARKELTARGIKLTDWYKQNKRNRQ